MEINYIYALLDPITLEYKYMIFITSTVSTFEKLGIYTAYYFLYCIYLPIRMINIISISKELSKQRFQKKKANQNIVTGLSTLSKK